MQYTYRAAYLNALNEAIHADMNTDSAYLWTLPMFNRPRGHRLERPLTAMVAAPPPSPSPATYAGAASDGAA